MTAVPVAGFAYVRVALELEACDRLTSPQLESFAIAGGELFPPR